jgi:hypothetical protein
MQLAGNSLAAETGLFILLPEFYEKTVTNWLRLSSKPTNQPHATGIQNHIYLSGYRFIINNAGLCTS